MELNECIETCNNMKQCYAFNYVTVGKKPQCFLYGYDEGEGLISDSPCGNKVGNTCCEKGKYPIQRKKKLYVIFMHICIFNTCHILRKY